MARRPTKTKTITLALQGGGAHGAFTWGVLDRLLEDEQLVIEAISGTSAGAISAVVLADGFEKGGRTGAREALARFWQAMSLYGAFSPYRSGIFNLFGPDWSPFALWFDWLGQVLSPYQLNPFNLNPLREVLANTIDFEYVRHCEGIKLYVSATNVRTNRLRIFTNPELSVEALLASACLPHIHQAVEIEGEHYWDGGFVGNPVLEPLIGECRAPDILIVQVNPTHRETVPRTAPEILDRVNEISFNSSLMREVRAIAGVMLLVEAGALAIKDPRYKRIYFHLITAEEVMEGLSLRSKFDTDWSFLTRLRDLGRERAERWLTEHIEHLGKHTTIDLKAWWYGAYSRGLS